MDNHFFILKTLFMTTHHSINLGGNNLGIRFILKAYISMLVKLVFLLNPAIFAALIYATITIVDYFDIPA